MNKFFRHPVIFTLSMSLFTLTLLSCMWDKDTIEMERNQFPSVIELISGNFLRHGDDFHYWRIKDRELKLKQHPDSIQFYDDMAVSYSKLGADTTAIELMNKSKQKVPARYETLANLGTFHIHAGNWEQGLAFIKRAIEINPDAHFGREKYQVYLVEYILSKKRGAKLNIPLSMKYYSMRDNEKVQNFLDYLVQNELPNLKDLKWKEKLQKRTALREEAAIGILGMMKFGNYDSPILLEALGDILADLPNDDAAARQLAARAYLAASFRVEDPGVKKVYRKKAASLLELQVVKNSYNGTPLSLIESALKSEMEEGQMYFNEIVENERKWITEKTNPEEEFAKTYYSSPTSEVPEIKKEKGTSFEIGLVRTNHTAYTDYRPVPRDSIRIDSLAVNEFFKVEEPETQDEPVTAKNPIVTKEISTGKMGKGWYILLLILPIIVLLLMMRREKKKE